jgi:Ribbon-helix-helix protein, copG family
MTDHRDPMLALNLRVMHAVKDKLDALAAGAGKSRAAVVRALVLRATADA